MRVEFLMKKKLFLRTMKKRVSLILLCFLIITLSCISVPQKRYYLLYYKPVVQTQKSWPFPYTVQLKDIKVLRVYDTPEIIYRYSPNEIEFFNYQLWAVKPNILIEDLIVNHFKEARIFQQFASLNLMDIRPDFWIEGTVERIEKLINNEDVFAHLVMNLQLIHSRSGTVQVNYNTDKIRKVSKKDVVFVVRGLSELMQETINEFIEKINATLSEKK